MKVRLRIKAPTDMRQRQWENMKWCWLKAKMLQVLFQHIFCVSFSVLKVCIDDIQSLALIHSHKCWCLLYSILYLGRLREALILAFKYANWGRGTRCKHSIPLLLPSKVEMGNVLANRRLFAHQADTERLQHSFGIFTSIHSPFSSEGKRETGTKCTTVFTK